MAVLFKKAFVPGINRFLSVFVDDVISFEYDKSDEVVDEEVVLISPFFNLHTHGAMYGFKNRGDLPLHRWLREVIWPLEKKLRSEDLYYFTLLSAVEMVESGIVGVADMYIGDVRMVAKAYNDVGMVGFVHFTVFGEEWEKKLNEAKSYVGKYGNVEIGITAHSIYATPIEAFDELYNNKGDIPFHIHVSETREEVFFSLKSFGMRPVELLNKLSVLDNCICAHASWVTKREISLLNKARAVVYNPKSNMKLYTGGIMPFDEYSKDVVCLGTDGPASNNRLDFFEEMRFGSFLQRLRYWKEGSGLASNIFRAATLNGAKALGVNAGSVEEGKEGFVLALSKRLMAFPNIYESIVFDASVKDVKYVISKGNVLVRDGVLNEHIEGLKERATRYLEKRLLEWQS